MKLITVFTPTYNREHLLERLYKSLEKQTSNNFIWLIVDDGSTDNTKVKVYQWKSHTKKFKIEYIYKKNGGMHTAHNVAYDNIDTELNVCIDSDDKLPNNAIELIEKCWKKIKDKDYAGIIGLDAYFNGKVIGEPFKENQKLTTLTSYYKRGGKGDKKLVYRTKIINEYPRYPIFDDEKYVGLSLLYRQIDKKYQLYVLNDIICNVEYQQDGSTNNILKQFWNNPKGYAYERKFLIQNEKFIFAKFKQCIHYVSSSIIAKNKNFINESPSKFLTILAIPCGLALKLYIQYNK